MTEWVKLVAWGFGAWVALAVCVFVPAWALTARWFKRKR